MRAPRVRSWWIAAVVVGAATLGVAPAHAQFEEPPPVTGLPIAEAEGVLRDWRSDVEIRVLNAAPPQVDPALVVVAEQSLANPGWSIEQMPPVVDLRLGVPMPYLEGLPWAEARALLEGLGLTPSPLLDGASDDSVVTIAPTAGLPVAFGSEVRVKLGPAATAPPEPTMPIGVPVPAIVGLRPDEAEVVLAAAGLRMELGVIGDQGEIGTIVGQDPGAGTIVDAGTTVTATAERAPPVAPATSEPTPAAGEGPPVDSGERDGTDGGWLVPGVIVLVGVVFVLAAGTRYLARGRAPGRHDLDWTGTHVRAARYPDLGPVMAAREEPGRPHRDVRLVADRGPAPTYTEEAPR